MSRQAIVAIVAVFALQCIEARSSHSSRGLVLASTQQQQNDEFDNFLNKLTSLVKDSDAEVLPLKNVNFWMLKAVDGVVKNLDGLKRVGDASISTDDQGKTKMTGKVTIGNLEAEFDDFSLKLPVLFTVGGTKTSFKFLKNTVEVELEFERDGKCSTRVKKFDYTELKDVSIKFNEFSILNKIFEWTVPLFWNMLSPILVPFTGSGAALTQVLLSHGKLCSL